MIANKRFPEPNRWRGRFVLALSLLPCLLTLEVSHASQDTSSAVCIEDSIGEILSVFHRRAGFPGATIGYSLPHGASGSVSVGVADKARKIPMRPDHRMMAGSAGKTFFAALALELVEDGVLDLDKKISVWIGEMPWFAKLPNANDITLRMLLNHTAGIPRYVMLPQFVQAMRQNPDRRWEPVELLTFVLDHEAQFPAGQGWAYADTNFIVVGLIIEKVTQESCYNQIYRRILRPYTLTDIVATTSRDVLGLAGGYIDLDSNLFRLDCENVIEQGRYVFNPQFEWAGGGFASTPKELARWARLLYADGVLSDAMRKEMRTTVASTLSPGSRYGLGLMQRPSDHGVVIGHAGYFPGYLTDMAYYEELDVALAIQINTTRMNPQLSPATIRMVLDACANALVQVSGDSG